MLNTIIIILEILISFLLQTTVFQWFELAGTVPNILLILTVSLGFLSGKNTGIFVGLLSGLLIDLMYGDIIGISAIIYISIGYVNGYLGLVLNRADKIVPIILISISQFAYFILYYIFNFLLRGKINIYYYFINIGLPEIVYTTIVAIFLYRIIYNINIKKESLARKES